MNREILKIINNIHINLSIIFIYKMGMFYSLLCHRDEISETNNLFGDADAKTSSETNKGEEKGAYFFQDEEKRIYNFLFFKLEPQELEKALPFTYEQDTKRNYLIVIFDPDGRDFMGQYTWESVQNIISKNQMIYLVTTPWIEIKDEFDLEEVEYRNMVKLAKEQ